MSVLYKAFTRHNGPKNGPLAGIVTPKGAPRTAAYKPQSLQFSHERLDGSRSAITLPRRPGPLLFLIAICGLYAAAMFYANQAAPVPPPVAMLPVPVMAAPVVPPPSASDELERLASLMPEAVAAPLPLSGERLYGERLKPTAQHLHITVSPASRPVDDAASLSREGIRQAQNGDADGALDTFHKARALAPNDPRLTYNIALIYDRMGNSEGAIAAYRETIGLLGNDDSHALDGKAIARRYNQLNHDLAE